jgi:hypothetical protein
MFLRRLRDAKNFKSLIAELGCQTMLTIIGLSLDMIGVVVLFFNGPPIFPILPDGSELIWDSGSPEKKALASRKIFLSKLALGLIFLGFFLQAIGAIQK